MKRALSYGILAAASAGALAALAVLGGWWSPWANRYVTGIDVSQHQNAIDWRVVSTGNVRFAYIKATEGGDYRDPLFATNWANAARAGLKRGAYHFFTLCRSGRQQAANFIAAVPRDANALPPAVDLEHMGPCRQGPTAADPPAEIASYADQVAAYYGARPIFYTTAKFERAHLRGRFEQERFWVRSLSRWPTLRRTQWILWQRHNDGRVPGISTPVDINYFRGDMRAFNAFAGISEQTS